MELILRVFEYFDSFSQVASLVRVSRLFYDVWKLKATTIADAILPRAVLCFNDAQELVRVQTLAETQYDRHDQEDNAAALYRTKQLVFNHRIVLRAYNQWNKYTAKRDTGPGKKKYPESYYHDRVHLRRRARFRYIRCFYYLWILAILQQNPSSEPQQLSLLSSMTDVELCCMREMVMGQFWYDCPWPRFTKQHPLIPNLNWCELNHRKLLLTVNGACKERDTAQPPKEMSTDMVYSRFVRTGGEIPYPRSLFMYDGPNPTTFWLTEYYPSPH